MIDRTRQALFAPADALGLRALRLVFGLFLALAVLRYFWNGWIHSQFVEPTVFFPFFGWDWVRPLPPAAMHGLFGTMFAAALLLAFGVVHRVAAAVLAAGIAYIQIVDKTNYLNHYYLFVILLVLLAFMPVGRKSPQQVPRGLYWLLRFQVGCVYFFAGLHKLNADWLLDAQPLQIWFLHAQDQLGGPSWLNAAWVAYAASWAGAAFDLSVPFLLAWRRSRRFAYVCVVTFHVVTAVLFPIGIFPWVMIVAATVFFDPSWPRRIVRRRASEPFVGQRAQRSRAWAAGALLWCVLQVLLPLRSLAYPGDDLWTEEAFRFSWKVMLIEKYATVEFDIYDPTTGVTQTHRPSENLTFIQERMMAHQPDMVLQYAHHLRDAFERKHGRVPEIRARCRVMLNGRPSRPLVDPTVDLATQQQSVHAKAWLMPSPRED